MSNFLNFTSNTKMIKITMYVCFYLSEVDFITFLFHSIYAAPPDQLLIWMGEHMCVFVFH